MGTWQIRWSKYASLPCFPFFLDHLAHKSFRRPFFESPGKTQLRRWQTNVCNMLFSVRRFVLTQNRNSGKVRVENVHYDLTEEELEVWDTKRNRKSFVAKNDLGSFRAHWSCFILEAWLWPSWTFEWCRSCNLWGPKRCAESHWGVWWGKCQW